jgi:hypothetical protein
MNNIQIASPHKLQIKGVTGTAHKFLRCNMLGDVDILLTSSGFVTFENCEFANGRTITIANGFTGVVYFISCNFNGCTITNNAIGDFQCIINNCSGIAGTPFAVKVGLTTPYLTGTVEIDTTNINTQNINGSPIEYRTAYSESWTMDPDGPSRMTLQPVITGTKFNFGHTTDELKIKQLELALDSDFFWVTGGSTPTYTIKVYATNGPVAPGQQSALGSTAYTLVDTIAIAFPSSTSNLSIPSSQRFFGYTYSVNCDVTVPANSLYYYDCTIPTGTWYSGSLNPAGWTPTAPGTTLGCELILYASGYRYTT